MTVGSPPDNFGPAPQPTGQAQNGADFVSETSATKILQARPEAAPNINFLATISHEIRTPMNGVIGMLELLEQTQLDDQQRALLASSRYSAKLLLCIVNDILDFAKIEAGRLELDILPLDLAATLSAAHDTMQAAATNKKLKFDLDLDPNIPPRVLGDSLRIGQIMMNLLGNAIKFTPEGGRILLSASRLNNDRSSNPWIRIRVADTGIGMVPEVRDHLFRPFAQAKVQSEKGIGRTQAGTGLGLAICHRLVGMMGGTIHVESSPAKGATFSILLPFAVIDAEIPAAEVSPLQINDFFPELVANPVTVGAVSAEVSAPNAAVSETLAADETPCILVAEDNAVNRELIARQLEHLGYRCDVAKHGRDALEKFDSARHALVLTDCDMPVMNGIGLTQALRQQEAASGQHLPILAYTAHALPSETASYRAAGMDEVLVKPMEIRSLGERLAHWLKKPQNITSAPPNATRSATRSVANTAPVMGKPRLAVFDASALPRFVGADPNDQNRFLNKFARGVGDWLPGIGQRLKASDWDGLRTEAHRLKSSARAVGAEALADWCATLESLAREGGALQIQEFCQTLPDVLKALNSELAPLGVRIDDTNAEALL